MNRNLATRMVGRTIKSVEGVRARPHYRSLLEQLRENNILTPQETPGQLDESYEISNQQLDEAILAGIPAAVRASEQNESYQFLINAARTVVQDLDPQNDLLMWITRIIGEAPRPPRDRILKNSTTQETRREKFSRFRRLWDSDRTAIAEDILGNVRAKARHTDQQLRDYWSDQWSAPSSEWSAEEVRHPQDQSMNHVWNPITESDIQISEPTRTACGPDGLQAEVWRKVPCRLRALFFNTILRRGTMPSVLLQARTTMIPKKDMPETEADYRPITVPSVVVRQLHKIIGKRLESCVTHVEQQKGLRRGVDGLALNVVALNTLLVEANKKRRELHIAVLDVEKAFDRVSHFAIMNIIKARQWPKQLVQYIESVYQNGSTRIGAGPWLRNARGIRQGDPLSSTLFNVVMDHVLLALPNRVGYLHAGQRWSSLAFADDVVLVATSRAGITAQITAFSDALKKVGLNLNLRKSLYLPLMPRGGRLVVPAEGLSIDIDGRRLWAAPHNVRWTYLGVAFGAQGVCHNTPGKVTGILDKIDRAPLKPLQKLAMLRDYGIPSLTHQLVLGNTTLTTLKQMDIKIRRIIRKWLRLPFDSANAYIHGPVGDGGLGIIELLTQIPAIRASRVGAARSQLFEGITSQQHRTLTSRLDRRIARAKRLHETTDGIDLAKSRDNKASTAWISNPSTNLQGWRSLGMVKIHSGSLPTRVRTTRGRRSGSQHLCRAGCQTAETAAHVLQVCPSVRRPRCARHNSALNLLDGYARRRGWSVWLEPHFNLEEQGYRPDLLVVSPKGAFIIDVSVVSGSGRRPLADINDAKIRKYKTDALLQAAAERANVQPGQIKVIGATITWRGVWYGRSARDLIQAGYPMFILEWMTTRVLTGGTCIWSAFRAATAGRRVAA
uniref:Reverse transcriptase domain-containing protein n=1 Tax=Lygus hesperus TaxID=30085 RepID=A0A0K8S7M2_LYGHE